MWLWKRHIKLLVNDTGMSWEKFLIAWFEREKGYG